MACGASLVTYFFWVFCNYCLLAVVTFCKRAFKLSKLSTESLEMLSALRSSILRILTVFFVVEADNTASFMRIFLRSSISSIIDDIFLKLCGCFFTSTKFLFKCCKFDNIELTLLPAVSVLHCLPVLTLYLLLL